jgi:hypothetical protein
MFKKMYENILKFFVFKFWRKGKLIVYTVQYFCVFFFTFFKKNAFSNKKNENLSKNKQIGDFFAKKLKNLDSSFYVKSISFCRSLLLKRKYKPKSQKNSTPPVYFFFKFFFHYIFKNLTIFASFSF